MNYNEQLRKLQEQILSKKSLASKLEELKSQHEILESTVRELKVIMQNEQGDVERLKRTSLTSVFYDLMGIKEDKLVKEKAEAYSAKLKYDSAAQELQCVDEDMNRILARLQELSDCELEYQEILQRKLHAINAQKSPEAERIYLIESEIAEQRNQQNEISEAISVGSNALLSVKSILTSLESAEDWGTLDLLGGGFFTDMAKHGHLDDAQSMVKQLQNELRRFKTELADVTIQADMQVNIDGFLTFADYFFDGLFADWAVMDEISKSKASVENTKSQIEDVMARLGSMTAEIEQRIAELQDEKNNIIAAASV